MRKITFTQVPSISFPILLFWFLISCRSSDTENKALSNNPVAINVNLVHDNYEEVSSKNIQTSNNPSQFPDNNLLQRKEIPFSDGFDLVAELKPEAASLKNSAQASLNPVAAATPIQRAIKFRVVVYNASGLYDSSYIYSISATGAVTPDSGTAMKLNGGQSYTFIAYSYNTNVAPSENLTGVNLSTASVPITSSQDFMYYKITMTPDGNVGAQNNLNIVLTHQQSLITVILDSSLTNGYNITNISGATLGKTYPTANAALSTGSLTSSGTAGTVNVTFPANPNTTNLPATAAIMLNNGTGINDGTFNIASLTVGPLTVSNIAFSNLTIQPGVKYSLTLKLTPQDAFIDDTTSVPGTTIKAARINGKVWMRYNLGVDTSVNPDPDLTTPITPGLFGNYYQWGRSLTQANGYTPAPAVPSWDNTTTPQPNSWNQGTETAPIRTSNDPCPANYRVPTTTEFQDLANSTIQSNVNDISWDAGSTTNYTSIKVFTSKKDKNVKLSFPAPGFRDYVNGALATVNLRGTIGIYWTSSPPTGNNYKNMQLYKNSVNLTTGAANPNFGENVRCIRIN